MTDYTDTAADSDDAVSAPGNEIEEMPEGQPEPPQDDEQPEEGSSQRNGVRQRLKAAEAERDRLLDVLTRTRQRMFDEQICAEGLEPPLMQAAGLKAEDYLADDGLIDVARLAQAVETARLKLGLPSPPKRPRPNPLVGGGGGSPTARGLSDVLRDYVRGAT